MLLLQFIARMDWPEPRTCAESGDDWWGKQSPVWVGPVTHLRLVPRVLPRIWDYYSIMRIFEHYLIEQRGHHGANLRTAVGWFLRDFCVSHQGRNKQATVWN
jgi:hypothetical protein